MSDKSVLSDEKLLELAEPFGAFEYGDAQGHKRIAYGRAVAEAAIAADRAARAEPVAWQLLRTDIITHGEKLLSGAVIKDWRPLYAAPPAAPVVPEDMSPANVPMYWRDESSNACAYAAGFNACRRAMLATPAPRQDNGGAA